MPAKTDVPVKLSPDGLLLTAVNLLAKIIGLKICVNCALYATMYKEVGLNAKLQPKLENIEELNAAADMGPAVTRLNKKATLNSLKNCELV